ncbi:MAG TPA: hypothetical protein VF913_22415 [Xanthobacteraceae bacterium]
MSSIEVGKQPQLLGKRRALVLIEDRIGHYPEFREFFSRTFDLDRRGLAEPGYVNAPSGLTYALVFIGRSGDAFPAGVEIHALVPELEPLDDDVVGRDLWAILCWMIEGVGGDWNVADLLATGRLLRIPAASE